MRYLLALLIVFLTTMDVLGSSLSFAPGLSVKNAILYVILLALAARFVVQGGLRLELPQVHLWFGILIAYATLSWLVAGLILQYKDYTLLSSGIDLKSLLLDNALVFALYLYGPRTLGDAKFVLSCILLAVATANAIAIGDVAGLFAFGFTKVGVSGEGNLVGRVFGAFGHANETAALIGCLLPAYVAAALSSGRIARWFWALAGVVSATLMIMAGSRGAFVGLALAVVFGSYICRGIISWRGAATLAVILVAVTVPLLAFVSIHFGDILVNRVVETIQDPGGGDRTSIWLPVVERMMAKPVALITGFGWDSYDVMGFFYAAHNYYLLLWFELGIIGLGCYVMVIRQLVITARRAAETAPNETARHLIAFIYGIIGISGAIFFTLIFHPWPYVWAYVGLTMRMAVIAMQTAQPNARNGRRRAAAIHSFPAVGRTARPRLPATQRSH
jgi:O-antigen ligase